MTPFCYYRKHWFLSYVIFSIILSIILNALAVPASTQAGLGLGYFVIHILIFVFGVQKDECFKEKLKDDAERIQNYRNALSGQQQSY